MIAARTHTVLHAWPQYAPGHFADLHGELLRRSLYGSALIAEQLIDNGNDPYPNTYWLERDTSLLGPAGWVRKLRRKVEGPVRTKRLADLIRRELTAHQADVLHFHFATHAARLVPYLEGVALPIVVTLYGVDASAAVQDPAWTPRYARLYQRADRLVVLSELVRDRLQNAGCPASKIVVWDMPIDFEPYPYREPTPAQTVRLLTAARFVEKKGYPVLLEALAKLTSRGFDVTLTAIGYGPLADAIRKQADELGVGGRFTLIDTSVHRGFTSLYAAALATHDIFVLPSTVARNGDDEGGPALTLVMAQAAGLPVVCTPFIGSERSVIDGDTGLLCEPDSPGSLAETIAALIPRHDRWRSLGLSASRYVRQRFDMDRQVDAMADLYRSLLC